MRKLRFSSNRSIQSTFQAVRARLCLCVYLLHLTVCPSCALAQTSFPTRQRRCACSIALDKPNCKLQLDFYHLAMAGGGLVADASRKADAPVDAAKLEASVRQLLPRAAHVQLANPPSRNERASARWISCPLLELLDEQGYDGYVGCEYKPSGGDTTQASIANVAGRGDILGNNQLSVIC